jgi:hypothetical protein
MKICPDGPSKFGRHQKPIRGRSMMDRKTDSQASEISGMGLGIAVGIAIGSGFGAAVGVALHNIAVGVALGSGFGVAIGAAIGAGLKKGKGTSKSNWTPHE